ncbi:MAG: mechanosensitive ion channel family protein [Maricaulaceae bacterium]
MTHLLNFLTQVTPAMQATEIAPDAVEAVANIGPALMEDPAAFAQHYGNMAVEKTVFFVPKILAALIVLWIGFWIAKKVYNGLNKFFGKSKTLEPMIGNLAAKAAKYAVLLATFLAAISMVGVDVAKIFVILSAATLAIGLALEGSMANVAAGLLLIVFRPYKIGDYVEVAGEEGVVEDLNIFTTTLRTLDNIKVIVANNEVRGGTIRNFSSLGKRRVDVDFGIDYDDDMDKAIKIIKDTAAKHAQVLSEPEGPWAKVSYLNNSSVDIQMRVWCDTNDYWDVRFDLLKDIKEAFDKGGISIPYPHCVEIEK